MDELTIPRMLCIFCFGSALGICLNIENVKNSFVNNNIFHFSRSKIDLLCGFLVWVIAPLFVVIGLALLISFELNFMKLLGPLLLAAIGLSFVITAVFWGINLSKLAKETTANIQQQHAAPSIASDNKPGLSAESFEIIPPDPTKTEVTSYEVEESQKDIETAQEIYYEIYFVGIKNVSKEHRTLESVGLKSRTTRQDVKKITQQGVTRTFMPLALEYQDMSVVGATDDKRVDINPGETRYFKFAYSYSLYKPAFSRKDMYGGKIINKSEYIQLFSKARNGGYFNFYNVIKVGEAILEMPFQLKRSEDSLPMGVFCISAKNTPPKYFKLEVLGDEGGSIKFHIEVLSTFDETVNSIEIMR